MDLDPKNTFESIKSLARYGFGPPKTHLNRSNAWHPIDLDPQNAFESIKSLVSYRSGPPKTLLESPFWPPKNSKTPGIQKVVKFPWQTWQFGPIYFLGAPRAIWGVLRAHLCPRGSEGDFLVHRTLLSYKMRVFYPNPPLYDPSICCKTLWNRGKKTL